MYRSSLLLLLAVACARRPEEMVADSGEDVPALVAEASRDRVVLLTGDRQVLTLTEAPGTTVTFGDRALPGIDALMEGDRVRASFNEGQASRIEVEESTTFGNQRALTSALNERERLPSWSDTMRSPGGTINSPRSTGTWRYVPPVWRFGPPPKNSVTGRPTPADQRPSF